MPTPNSPEPNRVPTGRLDIRHQLQHEGKDWDVGIFYVHTATSLTKVAAARPKGEEAVILWPTLLDKDGNIEQFELQSVRRGLRHTLSPEALPAEVLEATKMVAAREQLLGATKDLSLAGRNAAFEKEVNSHIMKVDGLIGTVKIVETATGKVAGIDVFDPIENSRESYLLTVQSVDENLQIDKSMLVKTLPGGGFTGAAKGSLHARMEEELTRFAQRQKLFGSAQKKVNEVYDKQATALLADSDIDREGAQMLYDHFSNEVDAALDAKDESRFRDAVGKRNSYREALDLLNKPKDHFQRQGFEEKQANSVDLEHPSRVQLLNEERQRNQDGKDNGRSR